MIFYPTANPPISNPMISKEGTITIHAPRARPSVFLFATKEDYLHWITDREFRPRERIVGLEVSKPGSYRWNLHHVGSGNLTIYGYHFDTPQPYHDSTFTVWATVVNDYRTDISITR